MRLAVVCMAAGLALAGCRDEPKASPTEPEAPAEKTGARLVPAKPGDQPAAVLVKAEMERARAANRRVVVYVGATWCEPCRRFHDAVAAGKLDQTFPDVTFVEFDADQHEAALGPSGYKSRYIPLFSVPGEDGRDAGRRMAGAIKGDGALDYIVPRLNAILAPPTP